MDSGLTRPLVDIIKPLFSNGFTQVQTTNFIANFSLYHLLPSKLPTMENKARQKASVLGTHNVEHTGNVYTNMADMKCAHVTPHLLHRVYTDEDFAFIGPRLAWYVKLHSYG